MVKQNMYEVKQLNKKVANSNKTYIYRVGKIFPENKICHYFKTNYRKLKLHTSYFISKPLKTITQSSFQYAILQQQLVAQYVL